MLAAFSIVPTVATTLVWPENEPLRETIWGELARIPSGLGNARFVYSLSSNVIVWARPTRAEGAALVGAAAITAFTLAVVSSSVSIKGKARGVSAWGTGAVAVSLCLIATATASAVFKYPYGARSNGATPNFVDLVPSIVGTRTSASPGEEVDFTVYLDNPTRDTLTQVLLKLKLSSGLKLLGPPFYERGSGCVGTSTIVCNIDFLEARQSTLLRLGVQVTSPPGATETVQATVTSEGMFSQHTAESKIVIKR